jgi:NADP-dependent 3-hydroxy acid dehydrogenase YdfG
MTKTRFITGTSSGFGRLMTESLLTGGDRVAATLRKVEALDDIRAQQRGRLWVAGLDVIDAAAVRCVMAQAFRDLGRIDVVVNNAAYG